MYVCIYIYIWGTYMFINVYIYIYISTHTRTERRIQGLEGQLRGVVEVLCRLHLDLKLFHPKP